MQARALEFEGRYDEAIEALLAAASEHSNEDLDAEIAILYTERGIRKPDVEALRDLEEAGTWAEIPYTLACEARIRLKLGETERSQALVNRALEMNPDEPTALFTLAELHLRHDEPHGAEEASRKAVEAAPDFGEAYLLLAQVLDRLNRQARAHETLLAAARLCPSDVEVLIALASSYALRLKDNESARRAIRRATEINRFSSDARRGLAVAAAEAGDASEMRAALDRAMELDPEHTRAWLHDLRPRHTLLQTYPD
jgi:tetratricopeptide (TPR) repeat protein